MCVDLGKFIFLVEWVQLSHKIALYKIGARHAALSNVGENELESLSFVTASVFYKDVVRG